MRFARKKDNILHATVAFGVLNEEFNGEEYSVTNRGEVFKVMATLVAIVKTYLKEHPNLHTVEFTGEPKEDENSEMPTQRLLLYKRYLKTIFGENWNFQLQGNRMVVKRRV